MRLLLILIMFLIPCVVSAELIGVADYEYKYNGARGVIEPTFVICDCMTPPLALVSKGSMSQAVKGKSDSLVAVVAVRASSTASEEADKELKPEMEGGTLERRSNVILGTVFFGFNSSLLTKKARVLLDEIIKEIKDNGYTDIAVNGYTCDIGTKKYNDYLAKKRAESVASYMRSKGVKVLSVKGEGKCCYISTVRKENRRVEVLGFVSEE